MNPMRSRLRFCLAIMITTAGCSSPGVFITRAGNGNPAKVGTAPVDGTYGLFIAGQSEPMFRVPLKAGDALGFEDPELFSPTDVKVRLLYAVAGTGHLIPLDVRQTHEWRRVSESPAVQTGVKSDEK